MGDSRNAATQRALRLESLPSEILLQVVELLPALADVDATARTCRHLYLILNWALYHHSWTRQNTKPTLIWAAIKGRLETVKHAVEAGTNVPRLAAVCETALSWASRLGHNRVVELLLSYEWVDPNRPQALGRSRAPKPPISWAAAYGKAQTVHLLLNSEKVDAQRTDWKGRNALWFAADRGHCEVAEIFVGINHFPLEIRDGHTGWSPLSRAAGVGNLPVLQLLLRSGRVDINQRDRLGQTPLMRASTYGQQSVVQFLLSQTDNVDAGAQDAQGRTALWWAATNNHLSIVELLLKSGQANANARDVNGHTALSKAITSIHIPIVSALLDDTDVDVDPEHARLRAHLFFAAQMSPDIFKLLLQSGKKIRLDLADGRRRTMLSYAAGSGNTDGVRMVLDTGNVQVDSTDRNGWTPLFWALDRCHLEGIKLLLQRGNANANHPDYGTGTTPLVLAAKLGSVDAVKLLLEVGHADPNLADKAGQTPMFWAVWRHAETVIRTLLQLGGANPNLADNKDQTPLIHAIIVGYNACAAALLESDMIDTEHRDRDGRTALSWAAGTNNITGVKMLLDKGADLYAQDSNGVTPEGWAQDRNRVEVLEFLALWRQSQMGS